MYRGLHSNILHFTFLKSLLFLKKMTLSLVWIWSLQVPVDELAIIIFFLLLNLMSLGLLELLRFVGTHSRFVAFVIVLTTTATRKCLEDFGSFWDKVVLWVDRHFNIGSIFLNPCQINQIIPVTSLIAFFESFWVAFSCLSHLFDSSRYARGLGVLYDGIQMLLPL